MQKSRRRRVSTHKMSSPRDGHETDPEELRRNLKGLGRARFWRPGRAGGRDLATPLAESVFRSSVWAFSRIEVSRIETDTPSRGESNRGNQRNQNEAPAEGTDEQNQIPDGKSPGVRRERAKRTPARSSELPSLLPLSSRPVQGARSKDYLHAILRDAITCTMIIPPKCIVLPGGRRRVHPVL